jgi:cell division protein FtsQ
MWDKPSILNTVANGLFAVAALLVVAVIAVRAAGLPAFALREVRIVSELKHVTRDQVEEVVRRELKGSFLTVDLAAVRAAFERLPWVRRASVERHWPARLDVILEEHAPFARWGAAKLVNVHGEVFEAAYDGRLPEFVGPEGTAREIAIQYRYFRRILAGIGENPVQVQVTERRAWKLKLESGLVLALGRENIEARLARFTSVHARTLATLGRRIDYVDLRYANGFAVRIPELGEGKASPRAGGRSGQRMERSA